MSNLHFRLILVLLMAFIPGLGFAAKGKVDLLPNDGGPPISLSPSIGVGALAGRFASPVGIAVNAIQLCVELNCINMLAGRGARPPAVPGWSDPLVPPSLTGGVTRYVSNGGGSYVSASEACAASQHDSNWTNPFLEPNGSSPYGYACDIYSASNPEVTFGGVGGSWYIPGTHVGCPNGYQASNGQCLLIPGQEATVTWPSDSIPTYYDEGDGVWKPYPRDPDSGGPAPPASLPSYDQDEYGNKNKTTVSPQADGGTKTTQLTEGTNAQTGRTEVSKHEVTTNNAGDVINYTYQVFENTTLEHVSNTTQVGTIELPNDYAREQTLQQVRDALQVTPQSIPSNLEDSLVAPLEGIKNDIENLSSDYPTNPAPQITVPPYWEYATGTCYPASWDVGRFGEVSLEKFCDIYDDHVRGVLDWMIAVWGVIYLYFYWGQTVKEI